MEEWVKQILETNQSGFYVLIAVFLLGFIGVFTCACNFSIISVVAGYSSTLGTTSKTKAVFWSGIFFLIGTIFSMAFIGGIIGFASEYFNDSFANYWKIAAGLICIVFGLYSIDLFPLKFSSISIKSKNNKHSIFSSIIFGLTVGGLSTAFNSCCNPIFPIVLAASFIKGSFIWSVLMLAFFALGYGLPLAAAIVGIGIGVGKLSKTVSKISIVIKYAGGVLLIILGFYFLFTI